MGYCPPPKDAKEIYTKEYTENYVKLGQTERGKKINQFRVEFVKRHYQGTEIFDYGAGAGSFVKAWGKGAQGYDVSLASLDILSGMGALAIPADDGWEAVTFWDSLEHVSYPSYLLCYSRRWVFISMPIYENGEAVVESKHYKPGEHLWYWTAQGLEGWMQENGFRLERTSMGETSLGREGVWTFAFQRGTWG